MSFEDIAKQYGGVASDNQAKPSQNQDRSFDTIAKKYGGFTAENQEQVTASLFGQSDFGEADISFWDRMRISTGDTFQEQQNIFLRNYPEGDFQRVPATGEVVFRRDPSESYRKFNPEGFDKTDLAAITGQAGAPLLGELAMLGASTMRSGGNVPAGVARYAIPRTTGVISRMVAGAFGGEAAEQGTQLLTGVQEDDFVTAAFQRPATEGAFSLVGGAIGETASRVLDTVRGAGLLSLRPGAREAIQAAERQGVDGPLPGQTTNKIVSILQGQSGQTSSVIQQSLDRTNRQLSQKLTELSTLSPAERKAAINTVNSAFEDARSNLILDYSSRTDLSPEDLGLYIQGIRNEFAASSQEKVTEAYNIATSFEQPVFNPKSLQDTARETAKQVRITTTRPGQPQPGSIVDSRGNPLSEPTTPLVTSSEPIKDKLGEVREIAQQIARADPDSLGIDQLVKFDQALFDLSQPVDGIIRSSEKQAITLRKKVKETLDNPVNQGKDFGDAWRSARESAANRFRILEDSFVAQIARTDRPDTIANKLFSPEQVTPSDVRILRRMSDSDKFEGVQLAFSERLLQDPDKLSTVLETFDQNVLSLMLSPQQLNRYKALGKEIDNMNLAGVREAYARQTEFKPFIDDLVTGQNSTAKTNALLQFINRNGGREGSVGRIIRTGLIEDLHENIVSIATQKTGGEKVRIEAFNEALSDFNRRGLDKFFTRTELRNLRDLYQIADFSDVAGEGVSALVGAETAAGIFRGSARSIANFVRTWGLGQFLTSESGRAFLQGVGKSKTRRDLIIPLASATSRVLNEQRKLGEDEKLPSVDKAIEFITNRIERSEQ